MTLADRMREHIDTAINENKYDYKVKSARQESQKDFFSNNIKEDPALNEKSVKSIHQRTLKEVWTNRGFDVKEIENSPKLKTTKNKFDKGMNQPPITADPKENPIITEDTPQPPTTLDLADSSVVLHTPESVGAFFYSAWCMGQVAEPELPDLAEKKQLQLGKMYKPIFDQYFPTQGKLNGLMTAFMSLGLVAPEIKKGLSNRKARHEREKNEEQNIKTQKPDTPKEKPKTNTVPDNVKNPDEMVPAD